MRILMVAFACLCLLATAASAQSVMTPQQAREAALAGEIILVDVRTAEEWRQTGVADVAETVTMHSPQFLQNLSTLMAGHPDKPVAFICATGGRTGFLMRELPKIGITRIIDVPEGMMGSSAGAGWIARQLPLRKP